MHSSIYDHLTAIIITIIVWEGNLWIDHWMNFHYPWVSKTSQRILLHLPAALIYSALTLYFLMLFYNTQVCGLDAEHMKLMKASLIISLMISTILLSFEIGGQLLKGWKLSLVEVEKYKTESVQAQLQNLKDQINPHFLFNNLSVLSSLVYLDQDKAVDFINQLSKVYRYLLDNKSSELVRLSEEMKFIDSYIYLLKIRFDKNIRFDLQVDKDKLNKLIPPMSVQMLVENAIKHNEVSAELPLTISITTMEDILEVSNTFQARTHIEPSSKSGLKNIQDRYRYFTERPVVIQHDEKQFIVQIPLIA
jgi:LytS/YehU family sensor histidine kinase